MKTTAPRQRNLLKGRIASVLFFAGIATTSFAQSTIPDHDLNDDSKADIVWIKESATGDFQNRVWLMNGTQVIDVLPMSSVATTMNAVAAADFDGDGDTDIFWRDPETGENGMWLLEQNLSDLGNGNEAVIILSAASNLPTVTSSMTVAGTARIDDDLKSDIVWRNNSTGENAIWFMNGTQVKGGAYLPNAAPPMIIAAVEDISGDGLGDIVFRDFVSGVNAVWLMQGGDIIGSGFLPTVPNSMSIVGAGDLNGDNRGDLIWRNPATGDNAVWFMNGVTISSGAYLPNVRSQMDLAGVGDFNGNSMEDLLWRDTLTKQNAVWLMDAAVIALGEYIPPLEGDWSVASPR